MFSDLVKIMSNVTDGTVDTELTEATADTKVATTDKPSPVEIAKADSNYLRGTIAEELVDGNDFVSKTSTQLLKHHGTYQQDDRERRAEARHADEEADRRRRYPRLVPHTPMLPRWSAGVVSC